MGPVQRIELKTERFAMAYRFLLDYAFVCPRLSKIAHISKLIVTGLRKFQIPSSVRCSVQSTGSREALRINVLALVVAVGDRSQLPW